MPIPAALKQTVDQEVADYCDQKLPPHVLDRVRLVHQWRGNWVTLVEQRPLWDDPILWVDNPVGSHQTTRLPGREGAAVAAACPLDLWQSAGRRRF
jgi:hypothetical protein